jgi:nicotinate-nucleotide--dimethylbenzimidazole phosphoribosyltransferase
MRPYQNALQGVPPVSPEAAAACQALLDAKTKPRGSLGRLEELACRLAAMRAQAAPRLGPPAVVVMAADHGVAEEGVSAFPAQVTGQMVANFARGGAALNVLARQAGARVEVVDLGVRFPVPDVRGVRSHPQGPGTASFTRGPAMLRTQAEAALDVGVRMAHELAEAGVGFVGLGEMGIGNSTAAAAITCALLGFSPEAVTGRGTGVDDAGLARKVAAVRRGLEVNAPDARDALDVLTKLGGFEIAGLAGVVLGAAERRLPVVLDGFIASSAALVAARLAPGAAGFLVASHRSVEVGHAALLEALGQRPLFDLELRLGEGSGAVLAFHFVQAALALLHEMATFSSAGVSGSEGQPQGVHTP